MCMYTRIWQYPIDWIFYKLYLFYTKGTSHLHKFYRSVEEVVAEPAPGTHTRPDETELCLVSRWDERELPTWDVDASSFL